MGVVVTLIALRAVLRCLCLLPGTQVQVKQQQLLADSFEPWTKGTLVNEWDPAHRPPILDRIAEKIAAFK